MGVAEKIPYLKELGVNQLLLMPIYDFDERILPEKEKNLPYQKNGQEAKRNYWGYGKSRYFAPKSTYAVKNPVKECKDLVKALHAEGIEVLMEVYFPEGTQERLIFDCLKHWVREYHVDGFYLMGDASMNRFLARDPMFAGTKLLFLV
ncbi:MAG: alpha-amylase family glycosyl hydrolase [Blautia sp.]